MDTSSTRFSLLIFLLTILVKTNNASPTPGLFGLDKVLHGTQYETNAEPEKIKLLLFTKSDKGAKRNYTDVTDIKELEKQFNGSLPFIIILHGFMGSPHAKSTQYLIQGYVERGDYNVIGVDWKDIAKGPWYGGAASGTYSAAEQLADWMNDTINANLTTWKNFHILGFSLGAQAGALTKKYIRGGFRVGRLIALDPARPNFDDKPPEDRLDAEDSDFTIVLHTCGGFLAVTDPVGHIDIYPNGGESPQPPCQDDVLHSLMHRYADPSSPVLVMASKEPTKIFASLVCSHYMALVLWLEAISSEVRMIAKQCPTWEDYVNNQCNSSTNYPSSNHSEIIVGETTPTSARGIYFIKTEEEVSYDLILYELISDGIREYSKLLGTDHVPHDTHDTDKGHGEVKEITPTVTTIDDSENKIEGSSSSSRTVINIYLVTIVLVLLHRLR